MDHSHQFNNLDARLFRASCACGAIALYDKWKDPFGEHNTIIVVKPAEWEKFTDDEKVAWYLEHKKLILEDIRVFGSLDMRRRWQFELDIWMKMNEMKAKQEPPAREGEPIASLPDDPKQWPVERKMEIAADVKAMGIKPAGEKNSVPWKIARAWALTYNPDKKRKVREKKPEERRKKTTHQPRRPEAATATKPVRGNGFPQFPPFSNGWESSVQIRWMEIYLNLTKGGSDDTMAAVGH